MDNNDLNSILDEVTSYKAEEKWFEFKLNKGSISNDEIGEYISALSNAATIANKPFGYLIWGVEDETHNIKGTNFLFDEARQGNQDLELWLRNLLHPKINFTIHEFDYEPQKHIVLLRIPATVAEPTHFKKIPYIRIGSHKTDLRNHPHYIRQIYNTLEDWSARIVQDASIDDLDENALKLAQQKFAEKHPKRHAEIISWDTAIFLDKAKITINGKITNTALILLGKEEKSHYLLPSIAQITWKLETQEKAYEHFNPPMLTSTTNVLARIRNIKYKFFPDHELLATEVNKYDTRVILEAMHNCIAHQDFSLNERIIVTEKLDKLIFENAGSFFEGNPEDYTEGDRTPSKYRNPWLSQAMVNLNMIDTMGYGIHTMYLAQKSRYFPLPDFDLKQSQKVKLSIYGHAIDENYTQLLIQRKELPLSTVVLLDRIQKCLPVTEDAVRSLRKDKLIEGRKPNYFIAASIAYTSGDKADYIKNRAFDDKHYEDLILNYLKTYNKASREDIDKLIANKLSDVLNEDQKRNKIRNLLYKLSKKDNKITNIATSTRYPTWVLVEDIGNK